MKAISIEANGNHTAIRTSECSLLLSRHCLLILLSRLQSINFLLIPLSANSPAHPFPIRRISQLGSPKACVQLILRRAGTLTISNGQHGGSI